MAPNIDLASKRGQRSAEEAARFVMNFVEEADEPRQEFLPVWEESLANYFVMPKDIVRWNSRTDAPFARGDQSLGISGGSVLKDPEGHQIVETFLAKIWTTLFSEPGYIQAKRVGAEDAQKGRTTSRLLEYYANLQGHPRTMYEWLKDGLIFGTGIVETFWDYDEDFVTVPFVERDPLSGIELRDSARVVRPIYDDIRIKNVDIMDFYPDPGEPRLDKMLLCAKRFTMTRREAEQRGRNDPNWSMAAVKMAISHGISEDPDESRDKNFRKDIDRPQETKPFHEFTPMTGFELWGEVPWKPAQGQSRRRALTVLNGEPVPIVTGKQPS